MQWPLQRAGWKMNPAVLVWAVPPMVLRRVGRSKQPPASVRHHHHGGGEGAVVAAGDSGVAVVGIGECGSRYPSCSTPCRQTEPWDRRIESQ